MASLFAGLIFGAFGAGYLVYGKRQLRPAHLVCGTALLVFPWFVSNLAILLGIGIALVFAPFIAAWWFGI